MAANKKSQIVIDPDNDLIFDSEEALYSHFENEITALEESFFNWRRESDIPEGDFLNFEDRLERTLESPDEIWRNNNELIDDSVTIYIKVFEKPDTEDVDYYVAVTYLTDDLPSFIYLHFPTNDMDLVERYRSGELVFSRALLDVPEGAIDGDALSEADEFAIGHYEAMMLLRSDNDIKEEEFRDFAEYREESVEDADEIWRRADSLGNVLVTFIKDYTDEEEEELWYLAVTLEDTPSNSHVLMFSFPTNDVHLVDRYRQGENLQAEEVIQEASH